jgi:hypothetical protein
MNQKKIQKIQMRLARIGEWDIVCVATYSGTESRIDAPSYLREEVAATEPEQKAAERLMPAIERLAEEVLGGRSDRIVRVLARGDGKLEISEHLYVD